MFKRTKTGDASGGERDPEFDFLSVEQGMRLRRLVREAFAGRGIEVTVFSDYVQSDDGTQYGLYNVCANCHNAERGERDWPGVVSDHVDSILAAMAEPDPLQELSTEEILARTFLRVSGTSTLPDTDGFDYGRQMAEDLVEVLVLDCPTTVRLFHRDDLARFDLQALRTAGLTNLLADPIEDYQVLDGDGATMHIVLGSVYTASKLLVLPDLMRRTAGVEEPAHGVLVCVPNRHQVAFHPIVDAAVLPSLQALAQFAAMGFSEGVGPVSPYVYWWQQGRLTQLSRADADGGLVIEVDQEFGQVLAELTDDN